jgi:hypothetical protein
MKRTRSKKSRDTVPLRFSICTEKIKLIKKCFNITDSILISSDSSNNKLSTNIDFIHS